MKEKRLFLFDVMPLLFRAHFATMGKRFGTTTGIDTRTTLVFFNYIFQVLTEEKPNAVVAALDSRSAKRTEMSPDYKATREKMPSEISEAFPYAMRLLEALKIPILKEEGLEADDIIATIATKGAEDGYEVFIVSPDKDFAQLVTDRVYLFRPAYKGLNMETLGVEGVIQKYGVKPTQIADYLALRGDSVDNIIGIKGIGDKTAASLLNSFGSIEDIISNLDTIKQGKIKEAILESKDQLRENKELAILSGKAEVSINWSDLEMSHPDEGLLISLLNELQFVKISERLIKSGFISKSSSIKEVRPAESCNSLKISFDEAKELCTSTDKLGLAYTLVHPESLFLTIASKSTIFEIPLLNADEWITIIKLIDKRKIVIGWELKPLLKKIIELGWYPESPWIDLSIPAYLLEPDAKISWQYLKDKYGLKNFKLEESLSEIEYLPTILEAYDQIIERISVMKLNDLLFKIELPLQSVLTRMEAFGINIDQNALKEIEVILIRQMSEIEERIYLLAGFKFNINSPGQTADVLMKIAEPEELTKTKTGQISTAENCLIDLAPKYPFVADLLTYRKLNKIMSTYVYALPRYIKIKTGRIYPTFQQIVAGTGRLSCVEPNLQNLPVRSEAGREVRKAIISTGKDHRIISIDYNQVELRLLAALSKDKVMTETFLSDKDIHTTTASRIFNVDEKDVTKEMRNKAKGVNFGIAYGISPWGLATRLKISQKEAKQIIDTYFEEFSSVKAYLERSVLESRAAGYSSTLYGRIRYIEGINSPNGTTRKTAERIAVNAPIQGLAADIIKEAMVSVDKFIIANNLKSRLILQVHDELVFDAEESEIESFVPEVVKIMEIKSDLTVPLKVNVTIGENWFEQKPYYS